jgi:hypothetical protein
MTQGVIRNDIHANFLNHTQLLLRPTKATGPTPKPRIFTGPRKTELSRQSARLGASFLEALRGAWSRGAIKSAPFVSVGKEQPPKFQRTI